MSGEPRRRARLGMASMTLAMALFSINDAIVKSVTAKVPIAQTMAVRGVFASFAMLAFIALARPRAPFAGLIHPLVTLRSLAETLAIFCLIAALTRLPIGDVTAISQAVPLVLLPAAALVLKEKVAPAQWALVLVGFLGIVLVAKPFRSGFDPAVGLLMVTTLCFAFRDLTVPRLPAAVSPSAVTLSTVAVVGLVAAVVAALRGFEPMEARDIAMLALSGLLLAAGQAAVIAAFRLAPVSEAGPFNYTKTAFAILIGMVAFGERPDAVTIAGMAVVVASGLAIALGLGRSRPPRAP